jgi:hypothetical protein
MWYLHTSIFEKPATSTIYCKDGSSRFLQNTDDNWLPGYVAIRPRRQSKHLTKVPNLHSVDKEKDRISKDFQGVRTVHWM